MQWIIAKEKLYVKNGLMMEKFAQIHYLNKGHEIYRVQDMLEFIKILQDNELFNLITQFPKAIDFLVIENNPDKPLNLYFVEVKSCWDMIRPYQRNIIKKIIKLGYEVRLFYKNNSESNHGEIILNEFDLDCKSVNIDIKTKLCEMNVFPFLYYMSYWNPETQIKNFFENNLGDTNGIKCKNRR